MITCHATFRIVGVRDSKMDVAKVSSNSSKYMLRSSTFLKLSCCFNALFPARFLVSVLLSELVSTNLCVVFFQKEFNRFVGCGGSETVRPLLL